MSKVGKRLIEAAYEAAAIARGEKKLAQLHVPVKKNQPKESNRSNGATKN